jgi:NitT/TauT family transport system ATP-binding protein
MARRVCVSETKMMLDSKNWQIRAEGLGVTYNTRDGEVEALTGISFTVDRGSFTTIVGPSGCGKSTLLRVISGLVEPTSGTVQFNVQSGSETEKGRYGMIFQRPVLLPWLTVIENVLLPIRVFGHNKEEYHERAVELLNMVNLDGFMKKYPYELSGGMQQRVSIARALVFDPPVLLMDEPFSALDAITREQLNDQLQHLWLKTRKTVLFVTHSVNEAVFLGTSCMVMTARPGQIKEIVDINIPAPRQLKKNGDDLAKYNSKVRQALEGYKGGGEIG